jgi:hypothetical protein
VTLDRGHVVAEAARRRVGGGRPGGHLVHARGKLIQPGRDRLHLRDERPQRLLRGRIRLHDHGRRWRRGRRRLARLDGDRHQAEDAGDDEAHAGERMTEPGDDQPARSRVGILLDAWREPVPGHQQAHDQRTERAGNDADDEGVVGGQGHSSLQPL